MSSAPPAGPRVASIECVELAANDSRWEAALPVLCELRPHLTAPLLRQVQCDAESPGLRFTALMSDQGECLCVAGWRIVSTTTNALGRRLFVDDLVTAARHRGHGHGSRLLEILEQQARLRSCQTLELDSGVQRAEARRFCESYGLPVTHHHFGKRLD